MPLIKTSYRLEGFSCRSYLIPPTILVITLIPINEEVHTSFLRKVFSCLISFFLRSFSPSTVPKSEENAH